MKLIQHKNTFVFECNDEVVTNASLKKRIDDLSRSLSSDTQFFFFYKSYLAQWTMDSFPANLPYSSYSEFNCCEQYMMAAKALLFKDRASLVNIMTASHPSEQQVFGRQVSGFNEFVWQENSLVVVYAANMFRYSHSQEALRRLRAVEEEVLVEASPTDLIWGIGLKKCEAAQDPNNWKGKNQLGFLLTLVKQDLGA